MRKLLVCLFLVACGGGAQARGEVTVTPLPTTATAQPSASATATVALPQASGGIVCRERIASICFVGGAGTSIKDAIVILGAKGEPDGVAAEYKYLEKHYGPKNVGHTVEQQSLLNDGGKSYDRLDVRLQDGRSLAVYFDISDYFGKF